MRMYTISALIFLSLFAVSGLIYFWKSADSPPSHAALAHVSLPPLISVRDYYANVNAEWNYKPSYDGKLLAWYSVSFGKIVVKIGAPGAKPIATLSGDIPYYFWSAYEETLAVLIEGRLWRVEPKNPDKSKWTDITPRGFQGWTLQVFPQNSDDVFVVASADRVAEAADLYTVRADGSGKTLLARNDGNVINWVLNEAHEPVVRLKRGENDEQLYEVRDLSTGTWRQFTTASANDVLMIFRAPADGKPAIAYSNRGRDKIALVSVDTVTGAETILQEAPGFDIDQILHFDDANIEDDIIQYYDGYPVQIPLTQRGKQFATFMNAQSNPASFEILGTSGRGRYVTIAKYIAGEFNKSYLLDLDTGVSTKVGEAAIGRFANALSEAKPVTFPARDGLHIPALLTIPRGVAPEGLPAIVLVHGGPASRDAWGYDDQVQFLANRGYAVLSVNYRGSIGFGKAFQSAGFGEVGKKMQDDLVDAASWLASTGVADKANIAIMGGSYGGYAAAEAMVRDPGIFKAAIAEYGVMDIKYQMDNAPFSWGLVLHLAKRYFGDPENTEDVAKMKEASPVSFPERVQGEILLTAGKNDTVVGFEQSEAFEKALKKSGKNVTAVYFEKEGHGYTRWQTEVRRARLLEDFLAHNLGGRTGNFDLAEIAAEYLD